MPTYNDGLGYNLNTPNAGYPAHTSFREAIMEVTLDVAKIVAARAAANLTPLAAGDVLEVLALPAQCAVLAVGLAVEEVSTGALTVAVGDGIVPDGFIVASPANAATSYSSITEAGAVEQYYYKVADTLDVTLGAIVPVDGVIRVWAKVVDGAGQVGVSYVPGATPS